jgi:iron complex outermembrane receptor protein
VTTNGLTYFRTGHFTQANLEAAWHVTDQVDIVVGGRNLLDSNYQLTAGFPEEGRNFFLNLRLKSR